ncbi:MAG: DUF3656 domain-containing protein, partial [Candidatus Gastranaerophilales bacterium]|nr:DUF3656 domain-containing protein [Candidatus Gastranaerophilales bacterium]
IGKVTQIGKNYLKIKGDISVQDGLCYFENGEIKGFLVNKIEDGKIFPNKMPSIQAGTEIFRNIDFKFNKLLESSKTTRKIRVKFIFTDDKLVVIDEDNNRAEVVIGKFEEAKNPEKSAQTIKEQLQKTGESDFYATAVELKFSNVPFLPISKINELRRNILEKLMEERIKNYKRPNGAKIRVTPYFEKEIDYRGNVHNSRAKAFYEKRGAKVLEMSFEKQKPKKAELMRTKHCIKFALKKCKSPEKLFLEDEYGQKYPLEFDCKNCEMAVKMP